MSHSSRGGGPSIGAALPESFWPAIGDRPLDNLNATIPP